VSAADPDEQVAAKRPCCAWKQSMASG